MKLTEIVNILEASYLTDINGVTKDISKGGASDLMSDILATVSDGSILVTGQTSIQTIKTAIIADVSAVVYVRNKRPPQEVVKLAKAEGIPILSTALSMFVTCGRLYAKGMTGLIGNR